MPENENRVETTNKGKELAAFFVPEPTSSEYLLSSKIHKTRNLIFLANKTQQGQRRSEAKKR